MCGRFVLQTDLTRIIESFDIQEIACQYRPSNNIFPGQQIVAIVHDNINRLVEFKWGLIPWWSKDPSIGNRMINARAETIAEKPSFKQAFKKRRCLIIADGFYEWQKTGKIKKPLYFSLKSGASFGFAGLHETWTSPDQQQINTCTIITTVANQLIEPIHDRMPVIVPKDLEMKWIDPENQNQEELISILKPFQPEEMKMSEVTISLNIR
ncbi:MAG: SOS response-associated peptidase [Syntrophaceae bacterium]